MLYLLNNSIAAKGQYNMKRSIVDYFKKKNVPEETNEAVV
jgi:5-hydroxyisourate hydrolase-like protein (transthyretin family)